ncbi:MAG TPA: AMP-binding protein [Acidimicrobiales bacterium]|nr:AMP-binding protein [Acidimicrobiales bacterium]
MRPATSGVSRLVAARGGQEGAALVEGASGRRVPWRALAAHAGRWADAVGDGRLPAGGRVGLRFADPLAMAPAYLAAVAAGLTVAPLDPAGPPSELLAAAGRLGLHAVVGGPEETGPVAEVLQDAGVGAWVDGDGGLQPLGPAGRPGEPGRGAALVLASSGTTGRPKLIPLTEAQLLHTARGVVRHHGFTGADRGYSPLPLFHINGLVVGVLASLVGGYPLVVDRRFSASTFWDVVAREGVTWVNLVPAILAVLATAEPPPAAVVARVAFAQSASAPLAVPTLERFERRTGVPVVETYGMTEAASQITANPRPPGERRPGSVGLPVGLELRVADRDGRPLPPGEIGQVEIRGDNVVGAYWEPAGTRPAERPARRPDGWLPTGDLGRLDGDGYLFLAGRADDVINRGGEKVYPREIEEVLLADPAVAAAAVVARPHPTVGEEPVAFVLPRADRSAAHDLLRAALIRRCEEQLSRFRRPAEIVIAASLPQGANGKVRHAELRRRLAEAAAGPQS